MKVIASEHLIEVDRKIDHLQSLRRELAAAVSSCAGRPVAQCRILEAFPPTPELHKFYIINVIGLIDYCSRTRA
ncbi:MAG: hypothetical protein OSB00_00150 [Sphingomonas bacterium]|nr:hypothetical protein [Sphingomonas bacterium]